MKNEIVLYQTDNFLTKLEVRVEHETVWLNRQQIATLFDRDVKTIGKHIANVLREELKGFSTVAKFATVQFESGRKVKRQIEYYNLDMIISIGYRVKSQHGIKFRIWANKILKDYLLKGYSLNRRMGRIENNVDDLTKKVNNIYLQVNTQLLPRQGVFFDGQIFDAYTFVGDLIRSAKKSLILVDNYIDDTVLTHFTKRSEGVEFYIFTKSISKRLELDLKKHNQQYKPIKIQKFNKSHDRFLIIDKKEVYHFGASLKDLGKKWFAFSRMDMGAVSIVELVLEFI